MKKLFTLIILTTYLNAGVQAQPFLYIEKNKLNDIRKAIQNSESHHSQAYHSLLKRVNDGNLSSYGENINRYQRSYLAQEAAFLSLLNDQRSEKEKYAGKAFETIREIYENPEQERLPHQGYGLSRAMMQLGLALPYAWCRQHWTDEQQTFTENKINEALDAWLSYDHANFGSERGSNWVAICRGGELILIIAANQKEKRQDRYSYLIEQLLLHMQNGYGSLGTSQEGMGYIEYGVTFLLKAVYAAASIGDSTLYKEAQKHEWWRLAMYAESFQPYSRKFIMTGVAGSTANNEGFASLLLNLVPTSQLPYYTWWYDRHMGVNAPYPATEKFDNHRAGTIWSIIYYPVRHKSLDPTGIYPVAVADDHGYYFFRNRWQDENDIMLSLMADNHHHSHAWDQPEVFCLNLMGYNNRFFGGPGKSRENNQYSTLLINGNYNIENSVRLSGATDHWEPMEQGANLIVNGHQLYQALGADFAQRHLALKFLPGNRMLLVLLDTLQASQPHTYTWQGNLGDNAGNDSLITEVLPDSKAPVSIKISGRNQAHLYGWFFNENAHLNDGEDPLRVSFKGDTAALISIFWLGQEKRPSLEKQVNGTLTQYRIGNQVIIYDQQNNQIRIN